MTRIVVSDGYIETMFRLSNGSHISFAEHVDRLVVKPADETGQLVHMVLGVAGEAGEMVDTIKKHWIYGAPLDKENLIEEIGDTLFYLQRIMNIIGTDLFQVMQHNVTKLEKRYPQGFTEQAALDRADKT